MSGESANKEEEHQPSDKSSQDLNKNLGQNTETDSTGPLSTDTEKVMKVHEANQLARLKSLTAREEALKAVCIKPEDVQFLVENFGVTQGLGERVLRIAQGDLKLAVKQLIS